MIASLIAAALLATSPHVHHARASGPASAEFVREVRQQLELGLTDYDSAKIKEAYFVPYSSYDDASKPFAPVGDAMCVLANVKNQMGGYVGYRWIVVTTSHLTTDPVSSVVPCQSERNFADTSHNYADVLQPVAKR